MIPELKQYQKYIIDKEQRTNKGSCLFLTMGSGKTRVAVELIKKFKASRILIISKPKIIKDTWANQIKYWGLNHTYLCLANKPTKYQEQVMLNGIPPMTIVGTNYESFGTSVKLKKVRNKKGELRIDGPKRIDLENSTMLYAYEEIKWDVIIIDESTCIKDPTSNVSLALCNLSYNSPNAYIMCLTGTPNPEASIDFYTQISIVDRGERFGPSFTTWRDKYFYLPQHEFKYKPFPFGVGGKTIGEVIAELCKDICYVLTKEDLRKEYNSPEPLRYDIEFELNETSRKYYNQMKKNVIEMPDRDITAINAAIVINKLLQISSGIIYDNEREGERESYFFGIEKIQALIKLIKKIQGKVIVCYNFQASLDNLTLYLGLNNIEYALAKDVDENEWTNSKVLKVLILQPASGAYGSNYHVDCDDLIWYEGQSSGEKFEQTEGRLRAIIKSRQCRFWYLLGKNTYDKIARDTTVNKEATALTVLNAIKTEQRNESYEEECLDNIEKEPDNLEEDTLLEDWYILEDMF